MPFERTVRRTSVTSVPMSNEVPAMAAFPPPVGWELMAVAPDHPIPAARS